MGKAKFWPPGAPKPLNGYRWNLEYITTSRVYAHTCKSMWRCDNVGGLGEHVKNTGCGFLGIFFKFFGFILRLAPSLHTWTDFDDLYVIRRVSAQGCAFWGIVHTAPHFGGKIPQKHYFGAWIGIFKLNVQNIKICILSKLLHRLQPNFAQSQRPPSTLRGWSQHA